MNITSNGKKYITPKMLEAFQSLLFETITQQRDTLTIDYYKKYKKPKGSFILSTRTTTNKVNVTFDEKESDIYIEYINQKFNAEKFILKDKVIDMDALSVLDVRLYKHFINKIIKHLCQQTKEVPKAKTTLVINDYIYAYIPNHVCLTSEEELKNNKYKIQTNNWLLKEFTLDRKCFVGKPHAGSMVVCIAADKKHIVFDEVEFRKFVELV